MPEVNFSVSNGQLKGKDQRAAGEGAAQIRERYRVRMQSPYHILFHLSTLGDSESKAVGS